jgi:hypothetical protein
MFVAPTKNSSVHTHLTNRHFNQISGRNYVWPKFPAKPSVLVRRKLTRKSWRRVPGSRFQVPGSRFRVSGSGYQVPGSRFSRVSGSGFQVPGSRFRVSGSGRQVPGSGFQGCRVPGYPQTERHGRAAHPQTTTSPPTNTAHPGSGFQV